MIIKIDSREPPYISNKVKGHPFFADSEITVELLEYGDIWIDDLIIERKTIPDLLNSIADNRLTNQAAAMRQHSDYCYLLIEGPLYWLEQKIIGTGWHFRSVFGALLTVQELGVNIIHSADESDLVATLIWLVKRDKSTIYTVSPRKYGVPMSDGEKLLSALPGIGSERAKKLLTEFGNVASAIVAIADLDQTLRIGIGEKNRDRIRWILGLSENEILRITGE